jgi:microcin C transport system ATP-binding protein
MSSLNPAYTIRRQVVEAAALTRDDRGAAAKRAREVLDAVGIASARHGAFPHELSGGMRQRVVIAMAVANEPSLVVADEPVTGLDVVTQARILALLLELRDRLGMALVLISHDLRLVGRVADQLLVMQGGRVVEAAAAETVMTSPRHPHTKALLAASPALREVERPR